MFLKKASRSLALLLFAAFFLCNCKKGEGDPEMSLRTRKARLVGEWNLQSGSASITFSESKKSPYSEYYALTRSDLRMTRTYVGGTPVVYVGNYQLSILFKKDGKFEFTEMFAGNLSRLTGTWNFLNGVGKTKNKESVIIDLDQASNGSPYSGLFCKSTMQFVYDIHELRNKRLVLRSDDKLYTDGDGGSVGHTSDYTFTQ